MTEQPPSENPERPGDATPPVSGGDPLSGWTPPPPNEPPSGGTPPPPPSGGTPPPGATPPPPGQPPRRLLRSRSDRMLAGVAGGFAQYFGIDAALIRIGLVVLTFFGGAGALLYLAAVLLVPSEDEVPAGTTAATAGAPTSPPERNRALVILGVVLLVLVVGPILLGPAVAVGALIVPLAFLALIGLAIAWLVTGQRPTRDAGSLLRATLIGLGLLLLLMGLSVVSFWVAGLGGNELISIVVLAAGVAIIAGAFLKPVRWMILPALAIALPAGFVSAAGIDLSGGVGERVHRPASVEQLDRRYELGAGELVVDLRQAGMDSGDHEIEVSVGMGEARIIVPDDVCVATRAEVGMGAVSVLEHQNGGIDVDWVDETNPRPRAARLIVDAQIGLGHLDVRKTDPRDDGVRRGGEWDDWGDWDTVNRGRNTACEAA